MNEERGLAVCRLHEFGVRAGESDGAQRAAEDRIGLAEECVGSGEFFREVAAHADGLRALPGEK